MPTYILTVCGRLLAVFPPVVPGTPTTPEAAAKGPHTQRPTNLLGTFLTFSSIVLQNTKGGWGKSSGRGRGGGEAGYGGVVALDSECMGPFKRVQGKEEGWRRKVRAGEEEEGGHEGGLT